MRPSIALAATAALALAGPAAAGPTTTVRATACFTAHKVLANRMAPRDARIPAVLGPRNLPVLRITFALIPAEALDNATLLFEPDHVTAVRRRTLFNEQMLATSPPAYRQAELRLQRVAQQVVSNVIVFWTVGGTSAPHAGSKAIVARCLAG